MKRTRHFWIADLFPESRIVRRMFGCDAVYLDGKLQLVLADGKAPWAGVLVCTDRERQEALRKEIAVLRPHEILPKWLYLSEREENFEETCERLVALIRRGDPRIGVEPKPKKKGGSGSRKTTRARSNRSRRG